MLGLTFAIWEPRFSLILKGVDKERYFINPCIRNDYRVQRSCRYACYQKLQKLINVFAVPLARLWSSLFVSHVPLELLG